MGHIRVLFSVGTVLACVGSVVADGNQCTGEQNILDSVAADEELSTLLAATKSVSFEDGLARDGPIGLIAPTNEAFEITLGGLGITAESLMEHPEVLEPILSYHVLLNDVSCEESIQGDLETALEGNFVKVNGSLITDGFGDTAQIIKTISTSNGPIYVIDRVLFPQISDSADSSEDNTEKNPPVQEVQAVPDVEMTTAPMSPPMPMSNPPSSSEQLSGLWNDLLQWSESFRPSNLFGSFFVLQV